MAPRGGFADELKAATKENGAAERGGVDGEVGVAALLRFGGTRIEERGVEATTALVAEDGAAVQFGEIRTGRKIYPARADRGIVSVSEIMGRRGQRVGEGAGKPRHRLLPDVLLERDDGGELRVGGEAFDADGGAERFRGVAGRGVISFTF
jgi:hypothetical protein